jgi:septum site-determining protein MinC
MTSDSSHSPVSEIAPAAADQNQTPQVRLKSESGHLLLLLPPKPDDPEGDAPEGSDWDDLWLQFKQRLNAGDRFWQPGTTVHLISRDRLLDGRQLHAIAAALSDVQLQLTRVYTSRRQTAVAAATAGYSVEQQTGVAQINQASPIEGQALDEPLYLQTTVRSGVEVQHRGTVIVLGDVNPGGSIIADGDILVWGRLRGTVHAGAKGNAQCLIMAVQMQPTQIRIAGSVARGPDTPPPENCPEVAYVAADGIRITRAADFVRPGRG